MSDNCILRLVPINKIFDNFRIVMIKNNKFKTQKKNSCLITLFELEFYLNALTKN